MTPNKKQRLEYYKHGIFTRIARIEEITGVMWQDGPLKELEVQFWKYVDREDTSGLLAIYNKITKELDKLC